LARIGKALENLFHQLAHSLGAGHPANQ
jgi:hypothetical protein